MTDPAIHALAISAPEFVERVLGDWDNIDHRRKGYNNSTFLANELKLFGLPERRNMLKADLELARVISQDLKEEKFKLELADCFKGFIDVLKAISHVADTVYEEMGRNCESCTPKANNQLKDLIASFEEKSAAFHQMIFSLAANVKETSACLVASKDLRLIDQPTKSPTISGRTYPAKASYTQSENDLPTEEDVLVEKIYTVIKYKKDMAAGCQTLASKLMLAGPNWNIPRLICYRNDEKTNCMDFIFKYPHPELKLLSLHQLYTNGRPEPTLNIRLKLCYQIAAAVLQAYVLGLTHKHIQPQNLLVSTREDNICVEQASLILTGWLNPCSSECQQKSESAFSELIHQYPNYRCRGDTPNVDYNIGYDIYSMGVCMLELLTWELLVRPVGTEEVLSAAYQREFERQENGQTSDTPSNNDLSDDKNHESLIQRYTKDSEKVKNTLIAITETEVRKRAGDNMADLICRCLNCLDPKTGLYDVDTLQQKSIVVQIFRDEIFQRFNRLLSVI
ncbi:uncharacterized protein F4807DRAFT_4957 [Annulohypoxylon truncatum]|uniref:uncharacterized protein n=1 Tax=Annulohypoxylon truncatum TaxID=327061 RepID=UPI0020089FA7|nr:uncharacterized protein F4807DRAFT_4957 [Annulohypoxylon truncatum]KAI1214656.1 hypothetical protein F4807DRAFT_4957 [Annulohypoxylon truncatum]